MNFFLATPSRIEETEFMIIEGKTIDMEQVKEKYLGRNVYSKHSFKEAGTFQSLYAAQAWLSCHGYTYGSTAYDHINGGEAPVAICKGEYTLPQKWHNIPLTEKKSVPGIMISNDFREGEVTIILFED